MKNTMTKISNVICRSIKNLTDDTSDALLTLQVIILALFYAKISNDETVSEFDLSDVHILGLGVQYSEEQLETIINLQAQLPSALEIKNEQGVSERIIRGAVCRGTKIFVYFNPDLNSIIFPTADYSSFNLSALCGYHSANTLALYLLLVSEQNTAYVHSCSPYTYTFDFYHLCRQLGLKYPFKIRPGRVFMDCFMNAAIPELKARNPGLHVTYNIEKTKSARRLNNIDIHISGLKSDGVYGLSPTEVIGRGKPWFKDNIAPILDDLISNNTTMFFRRDSLGRCVSATALLTANSLIATGNQGGVKSIMPLGYDKVRHVKSKDDKYRIIKAHLIARRFSGPDAEKNLIVATAASNYEMYKLENSIAKYLQSESGTAVLYRVEPIYNEDCLVPQKIRIAAINLDQRDNKLQIAVEIINSAPGIIMD